MGKNGQDAQRSVIRDLTLRRTAGSPPGLELVQLAGLAERARRHGNDPYASLRPAFHQLVHVRPGSRATVSVDFTRYEVSDGAWLWIHPGQVQRWGTDLPGAQGLLVAFPAGFPDTETAASSVADVASLHPLTPGAPHAEGLSRALEHLRYEYEAMAELPLESHVQVLRHLLAVLVVRLARAYGSEHGRPTTNETFRRFRAAVERDFPATRRVEDYAAALGYNRRTLTRATEAVTGMSAKRYIDERVALEAKRELAHGPSTVAAVAARLGFAERATSPSSSGSERARHRRVSAGRPAAPDPRRSSSGYPGTSSARRAHTRATDAKHMGEEVPSVALRGPRLVHLHLCAPLPDRLPAPVARVTRRHADYTTLGRPAAEPSRHVSAAST
ncbi:AraC family transcriptional regulator [Streptomyces enissocaesilis]|nr:AraC family transcriptional regulator [Streptomyces enissocaesilis]